MRKSSFLFLAMALASLFVTWELLAQTRVCRDEDYNAPVSPEMWRVDTTLLEGKESGGPLAEWSDVQGLINRLKTYSEMSAGCAVGQTSQTVGLNLYVKRENLIGSRQFKKETELQFYGDRYEKKEGGGQFVLKVGYPVKGAVQLQTAVSDATELEILIDDLTQLEFVTVPRVRPNPQAENCFVVTSASLVPSRVFDDAAESAESDISFRGRKEALERVAAEVSWIRRLSAEQPRCELDPRSYQDLQIQSLRLRLRRALPEMDFIETSIEFWNDVERKMNDLRRRDQQEILELKELATLGTAGS